MDTDKQIIFDKNVVEFVTVAAQVCAFLERASEQPRGTFVDTSLKLLPLLYLKACLLPPCSRMEEIDPETFVTEADYEIVRGAVAAVMADKDDYLEVFLDDMAYSDTSDHFRRTGRHLPAPARLPRSLPPRSGVHHERCPRYLP